MSRFVDRGAVTAAYVGIGMGVTIVASFTLIIPIEWFIWILAVPSGMLIGYYANQRSNRRLGPWSKILVNGVFAGVATGMTLAVLLLLIKAIFSYADSGYPDFNRVDKAGHPIPPNCQPGPDCTYQRYLAAGRGPDLQAAGVSDAGSFTTLYWADQFGTAGTIVFVTTLGGLGGAGLYGVFRPKAQAVAEASSPTTS
ncbi:MAG: hypothetical protein ABI553_08005 [Chloroflexota bacterium]